MTEISDNESDGELVQIHFTNRSERPDDELMRFIQPIVDDLELNQDIRFIFQRQWCEIDEEGNEVAGTERDIAYDGDATDSNIIRVCLTKELEYPRIWNVNHELEGEYLRQVNFFNNEDEFFVYFVSHECRHLFQWQNEFRANLIYQLMESDPELDADLYATRILSRYRQGKLL